MGAKLGALVSADAILDVRFVAVGLRIERISVEITTRDYIFATAAMPAKRPGAMTLHMPQKR